jgi:hypothetical protein
MNNLDNWNKLSKPPADCLKRITGGRLNGMTDIKPLWRIKIMTEVFGDNWTYTIDKLWTEKAGDEILAFALITLKVGDRLIPGIGGSMQLVKEKNGMHASDECYKMAVTDALSVAMKTIGVGAEVYMGHWDGTKYRDEMPTVAALKTEALRLSNRIRNAGKASEKMLMWCDDMDKHSAQELLNGIDIMKAQIEKENIK